MPCIRKIVPPYLGHGVVVAVTIPDALAPDRRHPALGLTVPGSGDAASTAALEVTTAEQVTRARQR